MAHFTTAVHDLAPVLVVGVLIGLGGYVATYLWEKRDYKRWVNERAEQERAERQERVNKFAADTRAAFEASMTEGRPHLAELRARKEAEGFDPEAVDWTQRSGR